VAELVTLPDRPILVLQPGKGWASLDLPAVWEHRERLYFLTLRDIKLRYKQTSLGVIWAIIQPLFPMIVFTLFFGRLAKMPSDGVPYAIFAYAGLLPWTYFANAVGNSAASVVGSSSLVTKVYFPRMIIPGAAVLAALVDFVIAFGLLAVLMAWYRIPIHSSLVMLPLLIVLETTLALGVGMFFSALTVKYRDVRHALPFLLQIWMFVTPIIFPSSIVPPRWRLILALNPLMGVVENFRAALFGQPFHWKELAFSTAMALLLLVFAAYSFRRMERTFADSI
jgi:lipopolysaccharide transport system permease protein